MRSPVVVIVQVSTIVTVPYTPAGPAPDSVAPLPTPPKMLSLPLTLIGAVHGLKDAGGVAVEGLAGSAGAGGLPGDGTVGTVEDSGGVGDAQRRR